MPLTYTGGIEAQLHAFSTSPLDGGELSASWTGRFTPKESAPDIHWTGTWAGRRAGMDAVARWKKFFPLPEIEARWFSL
jgi:hypothetical protein